MTFYITPPDMTVDLSTFKTAAFSRFKYLHEAGSSNLISAATSCESVIPNTTLDNISHFTLKCFTVYHPDLNSFILKKETDLFVRRLRLQTSEQMMNYSKQVKDQVQQILLFNTDNDTRKLFLTIADFYGILSNKHVSDHLEYCVEECGRFYIKVPFNICPSLVRTRRVNLEYGVATVTCGKWKDFLKEMFQAHYESWQNIIRTCGIYERIIQDERWVSFFKELIRNRNKLYRGIDNVTTTELVHSVEIDYLSRFFPPCMRSLHAALRNNHRLHHNARYNFSLFLKDIGMPLSEAMEFWKREYSKPIANCSNCTHSWHKEARRYTYSIKHLYGLVGSRIIKSAKSCANMQDMSLAIREEGGCPFVHYDDDSLLDCISQKTIGDISNATIHNDVEKQIMSLVGARQPSKACELYMRNVTNSMNHFCEKDKSVVFHSPVKYYIICKDLCSLQCSENQW